MSQGIIIKALSGFYYIESDGMIYQTRARGVFRKRGQSPLVGDVVEFESSNLQEGTLTKILPRKNTIVRPPVANVDVGIIVMSAVEPEFSTHLVDRFLVYLEGLHVHPIIMVTKTDLLTAQGLEKLEDIRKNYQKIGYPVFFGQEVMKDKTPFLEALKGQKVIFLGQSGVGKSTLIQILSGHLRNNGISVSYQGKNYTSEPLFMRQHIVKMPDQSELYDELNGIEHLNFYASMWKVASGTVQAVVEQLKMEDYIHQKVGGYSLGMRQRLCFALVLVTKADYMLVDEVMNGLDPDNVELISKVLRQLRNEGKTIVMASHLLNNLDSIADKIYFIKEKRIALGYSPQMEGIDTLQLTFISKEYFEKFVEQFPREVEMMNREGRQISIHLTDGELPKEKWKWILENIHQCSEIKIGAKGCYALYKELYG